MFANDAPHVPVVPVRYSTVGIVLHWLIAALVIFEVGLGLRMEGAHGRDKFAVFQLHKSVGITILLLIMLRILRRLTHRPPAVGAAGLEKLIATFVHGAFYLILLALPISGWIIVSSSKILVPTLLYGIVPWPHVPGIAALPAAAKATWNGAADFIHVNLVTLIYALFALHVAGALKHHFFDRDAVIARMAPGVRAGSWTDPRLLLIGAGAIGAAVFGLWLAPLGGPSSAARSAASVAAAPYPLPPAPVAATSPMAEPPAEAQTAPVEVAQSVATDAAEAAKSVSSWAIQPGSAIAFHTVWSGEAVNGGFTRFNGEIVFSSALLDQSHVKVTIDTGSVFSGDSQRDATLKGDDWFAVASRGRAVFQAKKFRKAGADRYVANGTLQLKGITLPIEVGFTLKIAGNVATMHGSATLNRLAYKIGEGEYSSTSEIPAAVKIDLAVKARRQ